jgi:hypothetical protein
MPSRPGWRNTRFDFGGGTNHNPWTVTKTMAVAVVPQQLATACRGGPIGLVREICPVIASGALSSRSSHLPALPAVRKRGSRSQAFHSPGRGRCDDRPCRGEDHRACPGGELNVERLTACAVAECGIGNGGSSWHPWRAPSPLATGGRNSYGTGRPPRRFLRITSGGSHASFGCRSQCHSRSNGPCLLRIRAGSARTAIALSHTKPGLPSEKRRLGSPRARRNHRQRQFER